MSNAYLDKREALNQALWDAGVECGFQKAVDFISIALNSKHQFGEGRLMDLMRSVAELDTQFQYAYTQERDADYLQENLDRALKEIYPKNFTPFEKRYPYIKGVSYKRSRKGWK